MNMILGEAKYIRATVVSSIAFTVASVSCTVKDESGTIISSGDGIDGNPGTNAQHELRFLFTPPARGTYEAILEYVVGQETLRHRVMIFVAGSAGSPRASCNIAGKVVVE